MNPFDMEPSSINLPAHASAPRPPSEDITTIYILESHRRLTAPVKPHEAKFEAGQPAEQ